MLRLCVIIRCKVKVMVFKVVIKAIVMCEVKGHVCILCLKCNTITFTSLAYMGIVQWVIEV